MSEPLPPNDEIPATGGSYPTAWKPPPRKWSFVALAVVLFVLVWVRELAGLSPPTTIGLATLILIVWTIIHVHWYVVPVLAEYAQSHRTGRSGLELVDRTLRRQRRSGGLWLAWLLGLLLGIWLPFILGVSPITLTLAVVMVAVAAYGIRLLGGLLQ